MKWFDVALLLLFWGAAVWHAPKLRRDMWQRCMSVGTVAFALTITARIPAVSSWIDAATGHEDGSVLVKHVLGVIASGAYLEWAICMRLPDERARAFERRDLVGWIVFALLITTFLMIPAGQNADAYAADGHHTSAALHKSVFLLYLGYAAVHSGLVFALASRRASDPALVWGLRLLAAGHLLFPAYIVAKLLTMAEYLGWLPADVDGNRLIAAAGFPVLIALPLLLIGAGIPGSVSTVRTLRTYRHLRRLRPLHDLVAPAAPGVTLAIPPTRLELRGSTDAYLRLFRTVVEIRDGLFALRRHTEADLWPRIRKELQARGLDGDDLDTAAIACWATVGASAMARGEVQRRVSRLPARAGADLDVEVRRLIQVQQAREWPQTRDCLANLTSLRVAA